MLPLALVTYQGKSNLLRLRVERHAKVMPRVWWKNIVALEWRVMRLIGNFVSILMAMCLGILQDVGRVRRVGLRVSEGEDARGVDGPQVEKVPEVGQRGALYVCHHAHDLAPLPVLHRAQDLDVEPQAGGEAFNLDAIISVTGVVQPGTHDVLMGRYFLN